jgi:putative ABC transport system ATP-binding protein
VNVIGNQSRYKLVMMGENTLNGYPILSAHNISKYYGSLEQRITALNKVSLEVFKGEFLAIMGPSGSGKSTLLHALAALDNIDEGKIFINQIEINTLSDAQLTLLRRENIGFMFQSFNLLPTLTAYQNIVLPLELAGVKPDNQWLDTIIELLNIKDRLNHKPSQLSGGQQQRIAAARALVNKPLIIFADEPTGNLDSKAAKGLLEFLKKSATELGQTIVMVTHDPNAASYSSRVIMLYDGKIASSIRSPNYKEIVKVMEDLSV